MSRTCPQCSGAGRWGDDMDVPCLMCSENGWVEDDTPDLAPVARHLALISADLRAAGDVPLVRLDGDGVTRTAVTLADELWLIAFGLNSGAALAVAGRRPDEGQVVSSRYRADLQFTAPVIPYPADDLYAADPDCAHEVVAQWSGVACRLCPGWYCA